MNLNEVKGRRGRLYMYVIHAPTSQIGPAIEAPRIYFVVGDEQRIVKVCDSIVHILQWDIQWFNRTSKLQSAIKRSDASSLLLVGVKD